jgi:NADH-ubiquinone oxidoreductase chain 6
MINIKLTDISDTGYNFTKNLPMGLNIASLLFFIFFSVAPGCEATTYFFPFYPGSEVTTTIERDSLEVAISPTGLGVSISDINLLEFTQIEVLGHFLYTYASIFLIILSLILLLAMLAIIIISKKNITNI